MITPIAGPTKLSSELCAKLEPLGLYLDSSVTIARNLLFNGPVKAISESNLFRAQIDA